MSAERFFVNTKTKNKYRVISIEGGVAQLEPHYGQHAKPFSETLERLTKNGYELQEGAPAPAV